MDPSSHREVAVAADNRCWESLELACRTPDGDIALLTSAFATRYHWTFVGGPVETICASSLISRAAAALGEGTLAVAYAKRANTEAREPRVDDWLVASTAEGLARAYAAIRIQELRDEWCAIADDEDRELFASQLATAPR